MTALVAGEGSAGRGPDGQQGSSGPGTARRSLTAYIPVPTLFPSVFDRHTVS